MPLLPRAVSFLRNLFHKDHLERELDAEVRSYVDMLAEENMRTGMSRADALRAARLELGGLEQVKQQVREVRVGVWVESLLQDLRFGARMLMKSRGFAAVAVLTLALGIGANTAIFSVVNAVLLRPLPYKDPQRLMWMSGKLPSSGRTALSPLDFLEFRAHNLVFDGLAAYGAGTGGAINSNPNLSGHGRPEQAQATMVTSGFFEVFGVSPLLGRTLTLADEQTSDPQVVILDAGLWQRRFGGDPGVVGKTLSMDGKSVTIIGVMPTSFTYLGQVDLWVPTPMQHSHMQNRKGHFLRPVGRLRPGINRQQAEAELGAIAGGLAQLYPDTNKGRGVALDPLQEILVGKTRPTLLILLGAVGLVLLIACANVANLQLARATSRRREIAIRASLGAGPGRLLRQLLTESVLLALAGGGLGVLLAAWAVGLLHSLGPDTLPRLEEVRVDGAVFGFTALLSLATGVLFGLAPALRLTRMNYQVALQEGGRTSGSAAKLRLSNLLVVSEVTLSLVLLVSASLLLTSLWRILHVNPGFESENVLTMQITLPLQTYPGASERVIFFERLLDRFSALPGVQSAGAISELPLSGQWNDDLFTRGQHPPVSSTDAEDANFRMITPGYLGAMRIPLIEGRTFTAHDAPTAPPVVIVNRPFVERYFPGEDALGRHLLIYQGGENWVQHEIVGIVGGVRHAALELPPPPEMYVPLAQQSGTYMNVVARIAGDPAIAAAALRAQVTALDKDLAPSELQTLNGMVSSSAARPRLAAILLGIFAATALLLAAAGIYGVISYSVGQRTHEIGIRIALGASRQDVLGLVLGQGMRMALLGVGLGLLAALGLTRVLASQLFGVSATDPLIFAGVAFFLTCAALVACYIPARRAMRVNPMVALRYE